MSLREVVTRDALARELLVEDDPDPDDIAALDERLTAFTVDATGFDDARALAVLVRDDSGQVIGGVHGWTWGGCCELVTLWVDEPERGRGLGRALLAAAERVASERECTQVVLFTHEVQAWSLYLRCGYEIVGQVDEYPAGSVAYWMRKALAVRTEPATGWDHVTGGGSSR